MSELAPVAQCGEAGACELGSEAPHREAIEAGAQQRCLAGGRDTEADAGVLAGGTRPRERQGFLAVEQAEAHVAPETPARKDFEGLLLERHRNVVKPAAKAQSPADLDLFVTCFQGSFDARSPARDLPG
jgi:hypothetical protein